MAGRGDEIAAGAPGLGHLRASHADREQVIVTLKAAFVQGMLDRDEFGQRVDWAFAARTHAELAAVTADLPAGLALTQPSQPARPQDGKPVLRASPWITGATALYAGVWAYILFLSPNGGDNPSFPPLVVTGFIMYVMVWFVVLTNRPQREKCSGGQPPRRPGAGGQEARRLPPADPGRQPPPAGHGDRHVAEAARSRRPHRRRPWAEAALRAS